MKPGICRFISFPMGPAGLCHILHLLPAFGADPFENDIMFVHLETVSTLNQLIDSGKIIHVNIKNPGASLANKMVMMGQMIIKPFGGIRQQDLIDFSVLSKLMQIAVHGGFADGGVLSVYFPVNLLHGRVGVQFLDGFQYNLSLNCLSQNDHPLSMSITNYITK